MPNWCEGTLKIRGTFEQLRNFVLNGLEPVTDRGQKRQMEITDDEPQYLFIKNGCESLYIKGSRRHFCEPKYIEIDADNEGKVIVLLTPMKAAWEISSQNLLNASKEFNVDMKIQGFEKGMEFSQLIEIVGGEIIQDKKIEYENWDWDCPCPALGG